jgi:hypothetical protein
MLTKIIPGEATQPVSARVVADAHPLPDLGFGEPAGEHGKTGRGTAADAAPVTSPLTILRDHLLRVHRGSRA